MPTKQNRKATNSVNLLTQIPLEKLAFIAALLFFFGSGISIYVAYQRLKEPSSSVQLEEGMVL